MRALTLEYHDVVPPGAADDSTGFAGRGPASYKLPLADFEQHLDAIAARGAKALRAVDWLAAPSSQRPFFLTFDDGGNSAHSCIADALERRDWRGHFFVTAGRIGTKTFLSATQIRELHARGHVIGSHSWSHPKLMGACTPEEVADEWQRSTATLADILGEPVLTASVPGGFYREFVATAAARYGVRALFTSNPTTACKQVDGCTVIGRYTLRRWSKPATAAAMAGGSLLPRASQWALYSTLTLARAMLGDNYTRLRQKFWGARG